MATVFVLRPEIIIAVMRIGNMLPLSNIQKPGRVAQSVGHLTRKSGVLGSIPGQAT